MTNYTITSFNSDTHSVVVQFDNIQLNMGIPVVDKKYLTGIELENFINAQIDNYRRSIDHTTGITNVDEIKALVVGSTTNPTKEAEAQELTDAQKQKILTGSLKADRDALLKLTDWTQCGDVVISEEQVNAWKIYRQELRDVTKQPGFPNTVVWPAPPGPITKLNTNQLNHDNSYNAAKSNFERHRKLLGL
jgi:hypothetical protein